MPEAASKLQASLFKLDSLNSTCAEVRNHLSHIECSVDGAAPATSFARTTTSSPGQVALGVAVPEMGASVLRAEHDLRRLYSGDGLDAPSPFFRNLCAETDRRLKKIEDKKTSAERALAGFVAEEGVRRQESTQLASDIQTVMEGQWRQCQALTETFVRVEAHLEEVRRQAVGRGLCLPRPAESAGRDRARREV